MKTPVQELLKRIETQLQLLAPTYKYKLTAGASETALQRAEHLMQVTLPEEIKCCYRAYNGSKEQLIDSWHWLSLDEMCLTWQRRQESSLFSWNARERNEDAILAIITHFRKTRGHINFNFVADITKKLSSSAFVFLPPTLDPRIQYCRWHSKWIPVLQNIQDHLYCIDLAPTAKGQEGQVIFFQETEYDMTRVIASDFRMFLEMFAKGLETDKYEYDRITDRLWSIETPVALQQGRDELL